MKGLVSQQDEGSESVDIDGAARIWGGAVFVRKSCIELIELMWFPDNSDADFKIMKIYQRHV